jgi:hypothetical protein
MESVVYENSPLADYLEGSLYLRHMRDVNLLMFVPGEGGNEESWPVEETLSDDDHTTFNFAPRGTSKFQDRVRNKLPKPLDLSPPQGQLLGKLYDACSVWPLLPNALKPMLILVSLVRPKCPTSAQRQRTLLGTIWLRYCRVAIVERAQCPLLYFRLRCLIRQTTRGSPVPIYNFWNSRRHFYSLYIFLYRLVITLEQVKDWVRTQSEESWTAFGPCPGRGSFVLRFRKTTMAQVPKTPGC